MIIVGNVTATHLYGGEITAVRNSPSSLTFRIVLTVYVNLGSAVLFGGDDEWLDFGDGSRMLVPEQQAVARFDLPPGIGVATFEAMHTYNGFGEYVISYSEPNWQESIKNIDYAVNTRMLLTCQVLIDPIIEHHPLKFSFAPVLRVVSGQPMSSGMSADNSDNHVVYYELITPPGVQNYRLPEGARVNPFNGLFSWDTKFQGSFTTGGFLFCIRATALNNDGQRYNEIDRTFMIEVINDATVIQLAGRNLDENNRLLLEGDSEKIVLSANSSSVTTTQIEYYFASELSTTSNAVIFSQYDSTINSQVSKVARTTISNQAELERDIPYVVALRAKFNEGENTFFKDEVYLVYTRDLHPQLPVILNVAGNGNEGDLPVYPNPVKHTLYFDESLHQNVVTITDAAGKPVAFKLRDEKLVDMSLVPPGLYYLMIDDKRVKTRKIIKQ